MTVHRIAAPVGRVARVATLAGVLAALVALPAAARVTRLLDEVKLGAERRMALRKFSKGMIQRVGIAQALLNDPELIFLDEPMSGLDPLGRRDVRELIERLVARGFVRTEAP